MKLQDILRVFISFLNAAPGHHGKGPSSFLQVQLPVATDRLPAREKWPSSLGVQLARPKAAPTRLA